jgi:arylsulfatase A-like enzyme
MMKSKALDMATGNKPASGLFGYLLLLTGIFILLEISFFIQRDGFYLADFELVSSHLQIPLKIIPGVLFFLCAQLCVHLGFVILIWVLARLIGIALRCPWQQTQNIGFALWAIAIVTVLLANQQYFPNSKFADLAASIFAEKIAYPTLILFFTLDSLALLLASMGLVTLLIKKLPVVSRMVIGFIFLSSTAGFVVYHQQGVVDASTAEKPNIILIGVDSLRPDFLGFFGGDDVTPNMDGFMKNASVFATALTPQARTFPAWMSILTGRYPKNVNARYDLQDRSTLQIGNNTLPQILRQQGYETIFATDETRFSNIDTSYGFDSTVTPPVGFNDFLLGTINDLPISNLIVNTALGKWLFPYSYGNRPSFITYNPDSFLNMLKPVLSRSRSKPIFFAVHFCLPHFPYVWQDYSFHGSLRSILHYHFAIQRADQQVGDLLALLEQNGILKHSIVVLLSDHGEALELHGDRATDRDMFIAGTSNPQKKIPKFYPPSFASEKINQSAGHGTDVMSLTQYHAVLAFRFYGMHSSAARIIPAMVSLIDIKPTILNILGLTTANNDGISLVPYIFPTANLPLPVPRIFFTESDFSPQAVRAVFPETHKVLFQGIDYFQIDPVTTELTVKKSMGSLIISSKQYAEISGDWMLALYPQAHGDLMPILLNLQTGYWTNDLTTSFAAAAPAQDMLASLRKFYGTEVAKMNLK